MDNEMRKKVDEAITKLDEATEMLQETLDEEFGYYELYQDRCDDDGIEESECVMEKLSCAIGGISNAIRNAEKAKVIGEESKNG